MGDNPIEKSPDWIQKITHDGLFLEKDVTILFKTLASASKNCVHSVHVAFCPRIALEDPDLQRQYDKWSQQWPAELGNSSQDWLDVDGWNAAKVFGHLLAQGFASQKELISALQEISKIKECQWARDIVYGIEKY
ncbi:MAG: hypothetical protein IT557_06685 [Alphaproteobacteria bacterium]|nr:hypothetical protein [Alphaproteobacteria bacterium]